MDALTCLFWQLRVDRLPGNVVVESTASSETHVERKMPQFQQVILNLSLKETKKNKKKKNKTTETTHEDELKKNPKDN